MRLVRRLQGSSLLTRFSVLGLLLTLGVGLVLAHVLSSAIVARAQEQAEWTVIGTVRLGLQPQLTPADLANGFDPQRLAEVDLAIDQAADNLRDGENLGDLDPVALKIFNRDRTIVWADDRALIGETSSSSELREALAGTVVSGLSHSHDDSRTSEDGDARMLEVYVPIQYDGWSAPSGVMELYLPYYEGRPNVRTLNAVLFETNGDVEAGLARIAQYIRDSLHAGLSVTVGREMMELPREIFRRYDVPQSRLDAFWEPYRSYMIPAVAHEGTTYFWRIPSAQELAVGEGWRWNGFALGWEGANITAQGFEAGWCFDPAVDPILKGPLLALDTAPVQAVEVTMSTPAQGQAGQLFWGGPDGMMSDERSVRWELIGDGQPHTYTVPLRGTAGWSGVVSRLRLDPIAAGDGTAATRTCIEQMRLLR